MTVSRTTSVWGLAFAYIVYASLTDIPALSALPAFSVVTAAEVFVLLYLVHSYVNLGVKEATKFLAIASVVGYSFEYVFVTTGWLGTYVYQADLSPFIGPVPAAIPFLWASLGYFCLLAGGNYAVSAALMMLWDVSFDPTFSMTLWKWVPPGQYFGVPLANFAGWFATALVIFVLYRLASRVRRRPEWKPIAFYFLIGLFIGVIPELYSGLSAAGGISAVLFAAASLSLLAWSRGSFRGLARKE